MCIFCVLPVCVQGSLYLQVEEDDLGEEDARPERERSPGDDEEEEEVELNSENEEEEEAAVDSEDQMWNSDNKSDRFLKSLNSKLY